MNSNLKPALLLLSVALACTATAFAQGGGRGRGAAAGTGPQGPPLAGGRFKTYPQDAVTWGLTAYNTTLWLPPRRARQGR